MPKRTSSQSVVDLLGAQDLDLAQADFESVHVREVGLGDASDEVILDYARSEDLVLVSQDSDFANLLAYQAVSRPSLILLRIPDIVAAADLAALLVSNLGALSEYLRDGAVASLTPNGSAFAGYRFASGVNGFVRRGASSAMVSKEPRERWGRRHRKTGGVVCSRCLRGLAWAGAIPYAAGPR